MSFCLCIGVLITGEPIYTLRFFIILLYSHMDFVKLSNQITKTNNANIN